MIHPLNSPNKMLKTIADNPVGTGTLVFNALEGALKKHVIGKDFLDFGCGAGRSSRFLKELGYNVTGVDISEEMIHRARQIGGDINYILIKNNNSFAGLIPNIKYDLILLSFVIMEIESEEKIVNIFDGLKKFLNKDGKMCIITASDHLYKGTWLSINTDFIENRSAKSGDVVRVFLKDYDLYINDYLWKESDCESFFVDSGLKVVEKIAPLGKKSDGKAWVDEIEKAPFIIYILK